MLKPLLPNYILVGHASKIVFAAKNTIRMAALTGRVHARQSPWGLMVSTKDLASVYVLRDGFEKLSSGQVVWTAPTSEVEIDHD